jgi:phytoene dehydrogenase-like protein
MADYDVVVVGGGPGGVGAAVRAAQTGARTLLIERGGFLGGAATMMMVNPIMPVTTCSLTGQKPQMLLNAGLVAELAARLQARAAGYAAALSLPKGRVRAVCAAAVQECILAHGGLLAPAPFQPGSPVA